MYRVTGSYNVIFCLYFSAPQSHSIKDVVIIVTFLTLCVCISATVTILLLCLRSRHSSRACCQSCCRCLCCRDVTHRHSVLRESKTLNSVVSSSCERPLSCTSLHSSSYGSGSYDDPDDNSFPPARMRGANCKHGGRRHAHKVKSMTIVRNSVYSDSGIVMDDVPAVSQNVSNFGSLGRNFRSAKYQQRKPPNWIPKFQEDDFLSDLSIDSQGQVPAQDLLHLEPGTSQPHYSATKFHSFRAKKSQNATKCHTMHNTSRLRHAPHVDDQYEDSTLQSPDSPLLLTRDVSGAPAGNGDIHSKVVTSSTGLRAKRPRYERHLSAQGLLTHDANVDSSV